MKSSNIKVEEGQIIYVTSISQFTSNQPNLSPYKVTKVNGSSFYAYRLDHPKSRTIEERFSHKTMTHETHIGYIHRAYLREEDYWAGVERANQKRELREKISKALPSMKLKTLQEIDKLISN
jgi:hypothetical protein